MPAIRCAVMATLLAATLWRQTVLAADAVTVHNAEVRATIDAASGTFSLASARSGRAFLTGGKLESSGTAELIEVTDPRLGKGQGIEVGYSNGDRDELDLFPDMPFALLHRTIHNGSAKPSRITSIQPFGGSLELEAGPAALRVLSTGGLVTPDAHPGGYEWMAVADPKTRHGVVVGWLTHDRAGGAVLADVRHNHVWVQPQLDYGLLRIPAGADARTENLAIGYFDDARLGLEAWASQIARIYQIKLPPKPLGYCTWYSDKHGGASDEKSLAELTAVAERELKPFGFSLIQIDDGWQQGVKSNGPKKVFSDFNPKGPYPSGMKATADNIAAHGFTPGIWFMPFAGTWDDPFFADHQDWFVKTEDGKPYVTKWGGTCLDMTQTGAREYLRSEVHRIANEWGYRYFKMDGMWTGTGTKLAYVNSQYKPDGIGDAVFSNPEKTNVQAYRDGLKLVREAAGPKVFLLGCCAPQNMRSYGGAFGLIDAMRVGPDNGPKWQSLLRGPTFASRSYFLNGRVWWNDPDPVYVRPSVPIEHARLICSWVTLAGELDLCSEWLPTLSADRLDLLKRTMPSHDLPARPVDLFENEPPRIWLLTDDRKQPRRDVIGLFNWTSEPIQIDVPVERVGLPGNGPFIAFDYWAGEFFPAFEGRLRVTLPKESCKVLAVRRAEDFPQLISTSRHVTQGIVDVMEEKWHPDSKELTGRSKVVANDPYEMRVTVPGMTQGTAPAASVEISPEDRAAGVKITIRDGPGGIKALLESPQTREVSWTLRFRR